MERCVARWFGLCALLLWATSARAVEIEGQVASVDGASITIAIDAKSQWLPTAGDMLLVFVDVPGVGKASVATGTVTRVDSGGVVGAIDSSTGQVQVGQLVTIASSSPAPMQRNAIVPMVVGMTASAAKEAMTAARLNVVFNIGEQAPAGAEPLTVYMQEPKAGGMAPPGSHVALTLYAQRSDSAPATPVATQPAENVAAEVDWGEVINPDGDCAIRAEGRSLVMNVPAGEHDLWFGRPNMNAPRTVLRAEGDFVVQVRVTARWDTGVPPPTAYYNGAGIYLMDGPQHYLRLERNLMFNANYGAISRLAPYYDRDTQRTTCSKVALAPYFQGESSWLRIARSGRQVATAVSHDGQQWITTAVLDTQLPAALQLGVHAIAVSPQPFSVRFDEFKLVRGTQPAATRGTFIPLAGLGTISDPDSDCLVWRLADRLSMTVPPTLHEFWFGEQDTARRFNAPRVIQQIEGDFVARVTVSSDWEVVETPANGRNFRAAGLLVWDGDDEYLRHERNIFSPRDQPGVGGTYAPPIHDRGNTRQSTWTTQGLDYFQGRSTSLLLQRSGQQIHSWISHDGQNWKFTGTQNTEFPATVWVGMHALSSSTQPFSVDFTNFRLEKK